LAATTRGLELTCQIGADMTFRMFASRAVTGLLFVVAFLTAAGPPEARISNGILTAKIYLPDAKQGYYCGTRFDWSGVINSLEYAGYNFYGPWFTKSDPTVRDFAYQDADIAVGIASGSMGPAEEFQLPLGYDAAKAGETFVKIGVGVLRKIDDTPYNSYKNFEIVDSGKWTAKAHGDSVEFAQDLKDPAGYSYRYRKTIRLVAGKPQMQIEHSLRSTGKLPLKSRVYDHNFLVLDHLPTGDYTVTVPYEIKTTRPPDAQFAKIDGKRLSYVKTLENKDRLACGLQGFGADASDYDFRIENKKAGAGLRVQGDRPLQNASLWSIRSVMAVEPFIDISIDPGKEFTWSYTYTYYTIPK
jgi:hypothetical protein